jgi:hypothetical protein
MDPLAWDVARMQFENDDDRLALLEELTVKKEVTPGVNDGMVE